MQTSCGNCGKPVGGSDITCPHCDALLAAYASPAGATPAYTSEPTASVADAVAPVEFVKPAPAPKIEIPDGIEAGSTAPRPLFDTNVTIEELREAAEDDHHQTLVVVAEKDAVSEPVVFEGPEYARPPSDAAPVPVVEDADPQLIARPSGTEYVPLHPGTPGENRLADTSEEVTPAAPVRNERPTLAERRAERRAEIERGQTEEYLRKLHARSGFESSATQLTRPIDTFRSAPNRSLVDNNAKTANQSAEPPPGSQADWKWLIFMALFMILMLAGIAGEGLRGNVILLLLILLFFVPPILNLLKRVTRR